VSWPLKPHDPRRLGTYELVGRLGEGGMGVVYLGRTARGGLVAIKTIRGDHTHDHEFRTRFRRELDATLRVGGRYVAQVLDADLEADPPYFVTEFIPGDTLAQRIAQDGPMLGVELAALAAGVATGLAELHDMGIAHRDVTPRNIVLSPDGPKIIDLGVAHTAGATRLTVSGTSMGTPAWMAPEHARGEEVGPPADVFSWAGVVLFAATGRPPFGDGRAEGVLYRIVHDEADTSPLAPPLRDVVSRALSKDPAERPPALEVAATLTGSEPDLTAATAGAATMLQRTALTPAAPAPSDAAARSSGARTQADRSESTVAAAVGDKDRPHGAARWVVTAAAGTVVLAGVVAVALLWDPLATAETSAPAEPSPAVAPDPEPEPTAADEPGEPTDDAPPAVDQDEPAHEGTIDVPHLRLPEAPWDGPAHDPNAQGERLAAEWWAEWMTDSCGLYLPAGMEADNDLTLSGPTQTRLGDVQFVWDHSDRRPWGLSMAVWPTDAQHLADYFESEPYITFSDGSEIYAREGDDLLPMQRLVAIAGEDCFYEINAYDMVSVAWGTEGLRRIELP
jgi:hypothetical protein